MTQQQATDLLPLVGHIARRVGRLRDERGQADHEDLVQEGALALLEAHQRFDPDRGARLTSYAYPRIQGAIHDHIEMTRSQYRLRSYLAGKSLALRVPLNPSHHLEREAVLFDLRKALAELPADQRLVLSGFIEGVKDQVLGSRLGLTVWQIRHRRKKALTLLRRRLKVGPLR
jgi:RNA polymerase sigma factor (sigma-70 family)